MLARWARLLVGFALFNLLLSPLWPAPVSAQTPAPTQADPPAEDAWLEEILANMTTADKVGQLFLVTFQGNRTDAQSAIARLVQLHRVGGVILSPENENFTNDLSTSEEVLSVTTALQELAFSESSPFTVTATVSVTPTNVITDTETPTATGVLTIPTTITVTELITLPAQGLPLFLAAYQEGDGYPYTALRGDFTELPSNMAVGATWDEGNAESVGWIVGHELEAVGINLLLGPSLDVLNNPRPGQGGDLGVRVFGGDPYWVGRMGQTYIRGVHEGSNGRVATVAKHLPGLGGSDRSLEEEIATVDKSLQDLRLIELPPFFAVTQGDV